MENFVSEHPGIAITLIATLGTSLVTFVTWWFKVIRSRLVEHIKREDEVLLPHFNSKFDDLNVKIDSNHVKYIEKFASLDKRLSILEVAKRDDVNEILARLDDLAEKMDEENG